MGIVVLTDVIAPNTIWVAGVTGKNMRRNRRAQAYGGDMKINVGWSNTLRQYVFGTAPLTVAIWQTLEGLFEVTDGGAYGFLIQDPKDARCTDTTGRATAISGTNYQLVQRKTAIGSTETRDRTIRHPKASDFILKISGTPTVSYTLNEDTGVVSIPAAPAAANVSWSAPFYVPVHFASDEIEWELVTGGPDPTRYTQGVNVVLDEVRE